MAEQPAIDPRYDPAFQRGYAGSHPSRPGVSGSVPQVTSALRRPSPGTAPDPGTAPAPAARPADAQQRPGGDSAAFPTPLGPDRDGDAGRAAESSTVAGDVQPSMVVRLAVPAARPPWTNPFAVLIAVIGVGVLGFATWLLQSAIALTENPTAPTTQGEWWLLQWSLTASPVLLALGVGILVTVLVLCAVYWGRRPGPGSPRREEGTPDGSAGRDG